MSTIAPPSPHAPAPTLPWSLIAGAVLITVATTAACLWLSLDPTELVSVEVFTAIRDVAARMWPVDTTMETLQEAWKGFWETLAISIAGTALGALIGLALLPLCCTGLLARGPLVSATRRGPVRATLEHSLHLACRLIANVLRTVPYFVWALLFWFMVGLGPFPGALAIAVHTGGVFARLYSSAADQLEPQPLQALSASGARRFHVFLFGMLPALRPALVSYTLYRWEVNIRESAVLGIIGPIGIGYSLKYGFGVFDYHAVGTYLLAIMVLVLLVDGVSAWLRRRLV